MNSKRNKTSYTGTKNPIDMVVFKGNGKGENARVFYQVCMCFGGDFKLSRRENAALSRKEAYRVAKYLQLHGNEIVAAALTYKV